MFLSRKKKKYMVVFGSITAALIILLAGFTGVVGIKNEEMAKKINPPLFSIRTSKTLDIDVYELKNIDYIGEEKNILDFYKEAINDKDANVCGITIINLGIIGLGCMILGVFLFIYLEVLEAVFTIFDACDTIDSHQKTCAITQGCGPCVNSLDDGNLYFKLQNNPFFANLVSENPNLLPDIIELNK